MVINGIFLSTAVVLIKVSSFFVFLPSGVLIIKAISLLLIKSTILGLPSPTFAIFSTVIQYFSRTLAVPKVAIIENPKSTNFLAINGISLLSPSLTLIKTFPLFGKF